MARRLFFVSLLLCAAFPAYSRPPPSIRAAVIQAPELEATSSQETQGEQSIAEGRAGQSESLEKGSTSSEDELGASATNVSSMYVIKRDGRQEPVMFDKITARVRRLCKGLDENHIDPVLVAQKVVQGIYNGVTTSELDNLAAETCAYMNTDHPDYARLAARISVSNLQRDTIGSFSGTIEMLRKYRDPKTGLNSGFISDEVYKFVKEHKEVLDNAIDYERDTNFDFFGFKTLERSYLMRIGGRVVERPQHMFMRVAVGIHSDDIEKAIETYHLMSDKWFVHASPTIFNAGTVRPQMSSCFLLSMAGDSIDGIYDTLKQCARISKSAGGIGFSVHDIRAKGSYIRGTKGTSNGLVPMLRVFDSTARYVDQGGGKRPGAFAVYVEPWHADIFEVLDLKKNHGKEEARARDLFYGLWIPDLFMKRVEEGGVWSLMCPTQSPGLSDCWGEEFEMLYSKYESEGRFVRQVKAQDLWFAILDAQIETGNPYMLYKDACNGKSNQQNLGTIKSSNLCCEIVEYSDPNEVAVCNLASIVLPRFVTQDGQFDHQALFNVTQVVVRNLNKIIDRNHYPVDEAKTSNLRHRPIGVGVQGLADAFIKLRLPFESPGARQLNKEIFETLYFAALSTSCDLAAAQGPYETYEGSPMSKGVLQHDMWGVKPTERWDWDALRERIAKHGVRNSLLLAPMPTASTAQIMGFNECIEPYTSNLYARRVKAGEFIVVNPHLFKDLVRLKLWGPETRRQLIADGGSAANIRGLSRHMRDIYKTVWEVKQKAIIDMAADRGAFIDQSQSLNLFVEEANYAKLTSMHFYGWRKGLKTGMYYLRTRPAASAIQFTLDRDGNRPVDGGDGGQSGPVCNDGDVCMSCQ
ncbi:unnamed protein product [Chrysoparadoxa australica]